MRLVIRSLPLALLLTACLGLASAAQEKPNDATLGAKPPEGRDRPPRRQGPRRDGSSGTARPRPTGRWRTASSPSAAAISGPSRRFGDFKLHLEFNVPYMPKARGPGAGQQRRLPGRDLRAPGPRLLRPEAPEQRLRRDLHAGHPVGERLQAAAPVADLRRHVPQGRRRRTGQGRQEGPRDRDPQRDQDDRRRRDRAHARRRRRSARPGRPDPAPGSRQRRAVSQYLDSSRSPARSL